MDKKINIIACDDNISKGVFDASMAFVNKEISSQKITQNINNIVQTLSEGLSVIKETNSWEVDEITLKLEISASGEVKLVGAISTGMSGGIEIKLKRRDI